MFKYVLQIIVGTFILLCATFIAWYEGSAIVDDSLEWKYSTPFTEWLNKEVTNGSEISQLDYFVYAVKFQPLYPTIMVISFLYILCVIGFYLIKNKLNYATHYWGIVGCSMILVSILFSNASTYGGKTFFWTFLASGLGCILVAVWIKKFKDKQIDETNHHIYQVEQ